MRRITPPAHPMVARYTNTVRSSADIPAHPTPPLAPPHVDGWIPGTSPGMTWVLLFQSSRQGRDAPQYQFALIRPRRAQGRGGDHAGLHPDAARVRHVAGVLSPGDPVVSPGRLLAALVLGHCRQRSLRLRFFAQPAACRDRDQYRSLPRLAGGALPLALSLQGPR